MRNICFHFLLATLLDAATAPHAGAQNTDTETATIQPAVREADGSLTHRVRSIYQAGETEIRVLLPKSLPRGRRVPVVYFLPVEPGREQRYGDPLAEAIKLDVANRYGALCVEPTFAALPWYADHPTDRKLAQETYFLRVVVPYIEARYPAVRAPEGRLLVGFSKSGWGAWSLLLRHPEVFGRAASWDAPLTMTWPSKYGSQPIFGTEANFEKYRITRLLDERGKSGLPSPALPVRAGEKTPRLILLGYGNFQDHRAIEKQLQGLNLSHISVEGPQRQHIWWSGWLEPALAKLLGKP